MIRGVFIAILVGVYCFLVSIPIMQTIICWRIFKRKKLYPNDEASLGNRIEKFFVDMLVFSLFLNNLKDGKCGVFFIFFIFGLIFSLIAIIFPFIVL